MEPPASEMSPLQRDLKELAALILQIRTHGWSGVTEPSIPKARAALELLQSIEKAAAGSAPLPAPRAIFQAIVGVIRAALENIEDLAARGDAARCAIEADNAHALPGIAAWFSPQALYSYWTGFRSGYRRDIRSRRHRARIEAAWKELEPHVPAVDPA